MMKKILTPLAALLFFAGMTGCNTSKMTFGNGDKWIPADFDPSKTTLLIEARSKKVTADMEEYMQKHYPYRYEIVTLGDIKTVGGRFADTEQYRYALVWSSVSSTRTSYSSNGMARTSTVTAFDLNFLDRSSSTNHPKTNKASSFAISTFKPVINTIVKKFQQ